jgi:hypothetical protein
VQNIAGTNADTLEERDTDMPPTSIADTTKISGFIRACLVDGHSGLMPAS